MGFILNALGKLMEKVDAANAQADLERWVDSLAYERTLLRINKSTGEKTEVQSLVPDHERQEAIDKLAGSGEKHLDILIKLLSYEVDGIPEGAGEAITRIGSPAVTPLITLLTASSNDQARVRSAYILGDIRDRRAIPALQKAVNDPDALVKMAAKDAMKRFT